MIRMHLRDLSKNIEIQIYESLEERFMDSEERYVRCFKKLAAADDFAAVQTLAAAGDWQETLRRAHNLKGVCGSLGLTKLQSQLAELVRILRSQDFTADAVVAQLQVIAPEWQKTLELIDSLA